MLKQADVRIVNNSVWVLIDNSIIATDAEDNYPSVTQNFADVVRDRNISKVQVVFNKNGVLMKGNTIICKPIGYIENNEEMYTRKEVIEFMEMFIEIYTSLEGETLKKALKYIFENE